ncbi:uncharacterized protein LOC116779513 isoform X4 [Danaus plexippus]|uniref:uncharacterized protein LOC116779513 isoform X4 n=1 Tax=Danaus plexippus TaxID=13037 RepID=UPI002AB155C7|nr:uncharacterized protein LOC116779513 isoform X4 [Danaus plexippus]
MDWIISDELGLTVGHLVGWGAASAMIVGGVAPYIPQYRQIKKTQDADGFSLYVCLTLLVANTLRILFWFGKRYELPLLIQSIVMNATMFAMIHLCVTIRKKNQIIRARERIFTGAIFMLYILLCCVNGSAQPDETANWLGQQSGFVGGEKPHRFYGKCCDDTISIVFVGFVFCSSFRRSFFFCFSYKTSCIFHWVYIFGSHRVVISLSAWYIFFFSFICCHQDFLIIYFFVMV